MPIILVVDDDVAIRECVAEVLSYEGYGVVEAPDGLAGLELLERDHPSVVVLDLMMPVMSGWQFRAEQKKRPGVANIPVIVVTASMRPDVDADRVLSKPFDLDALVGAVHEFADAPRA